MLLLLLLAVRGPEVSLPCFVCWLLLRRRANPPLLDPVDTKEIIVKTEAVEDRFIVKSWDMSNSKNR